MGNTNIAIKKSYDVLLRVYTSIFRKNTKLSQYLEIEYVGVLRCQEHEYDHKKSPSIVLRVYMLIFQIFVFCIFSKYRRVDPQEYIIRIFYCDIRIPHV